MLLEAGGKHRLSFFSDVRIGAIVCEQNCSKIEGVHAVQFQLSLWT